MARPVLQAALAGEAALEAWLRQWLLELRTALFLSGSRRPAELRRKPRVITGDTQAWLSALS